MQVEEGKMLCMIQRGHTQEANTGLGPAQETMMTISLLALEDYGEAMRARMIQNR